MGRPLVVLLMGVCGSGKTTLGRSLAARLGWAFLDADDLHRPESRTEMAAGQSLDDTTRTEWIERVAGAVKVHVERSEPIILACSALLSRHRDILVAAAGRGLVIAHLRGTRSLIADRLRKREGHFAGVSLLESQMETLEPPEGVLELDITQPNEVLVDQLLHVLEKEGVLSD